jgi:hypothetical protein
MAGQESYEAFRVRFDGAAISTYALLMIVVPMKIWCRTQVSGWKSIGWDDWLSVATLAFANVWFWDNMIGKRSQFCVVFSLPFELKITPRADQFN